MRGLVLIMVLATAVACVSKRERRQLAYRAEQSGVDVRQDSARWALELATTTVQVLELEQWHKTGDTTPMERSYRRLRVYTKRADSSTADAAATSATASRYNAREKVETATKKTTARRSGWWVWVVAILLLALVEYRVVRWIGGHG